MFTLLVVERARWLEERSLNNVLERNSFAGIDRRNIIFVSVCEFIMTGKCLCGSWAVEEDGNNSFGRKSLIINES